VSAKSRIAAAVAVAALIATLAWYGVEHRASAGNFAGPGELVALNPFGIARDVATDDTTTSDSQDLAMLDFSYEKLEQVYYKPVDSASLIRGEQHGLVEYLKSQHIAAQLADPAAGGSANEDAVDGILRSAFDKYGSKVGDDDLTYAAISGMLDSLDDPYTVFLDPRDKRQLTELISGGNFGGIGVYIGQDDKTKQTVIIEPIDGTPADRAGLKPGDIIVSVDGHPTRGLSLDPVMNLIRGKADSTVHLVIKRGTEAEHEVDVVRQEIHVPSVASRMIDGDVGYVQLFDFGETSAEELNAALDKLGNEGAKAYLLDLRNNGGGLLDAAVDVSSKFIADGPIVSTIDRQGDMETRDADGDSITPRPLIVLVNQYTASASEITAGAIQDTKVGTLLGVKTFGKGVVQTIYDLPGESAIKITTARYVTPAGRDINKKGIEPNIIVPMDPRLVGVVGKDVQLQAALQDIKKQIALDH
jgi:carboxyl-terminal processing protease